MYVLGKCKKCGSRGVLDIADLSDRRAKEILSEMPFGECKFNGWHVEIGSMTEYIEVDYSTKYETKEDAEEVLTELKKGA